MSAWSDCPEWFDEWIMERALDGDMGEEIRPKAENNEIDPSDLWDMDKDGKWASKADEAFWDRCADMADVGREFDR
jgi:hypothetical protein